MNKYGCALFQLLLVFGCASTPNSSVAAVPDEANGSDTSVRMILRRDVQAQLARGLGDFLSRIELEPSLDGGKFQGFRVVALTDPELWAGVDLQPGDVVRKVNGADLEEPDTVFNTFVALKQAPEVNVELLREGAPRTLRYPIIGDPPMGQAGTSSTSTKPSQAAQPATTTTPAASAPVQPGKAQKAAGPKTAK